MLLFPDYWEVKCVCVSVRVRVDVRVHFCQLFSLKPATLRLVIRHPHMRDCRPNTGMTRPPFDTTIADLLELRSMWFHFEAPNMACIKHDTAVDEWSYL